MKNRISWTRRCEDGVKREVRVLVTAHHTKWQFKREDEERWDYDRGPTKEEWDTLEEILERRVNRGRGIGMLENVRKLRGKAGG
jgi:hypothetical protein